MLIIFIVLAGIGITCGTVFVVRDIEIVDARTQTAETLTETEKNDIIQQTGLQGKNILFNIDQDKIAQKIKSVNSMLKLQSVTAKFPNRVVLTIVRRVPIFYDSTNELWFDSEMCVVEGTAPYCVNITNANLGLKENLSVGDMAVGKDEWSQSKIEQLRILAGYFELQGKSLEGFEIAYDDDHGDVGNYLCSLLKINSGTTFKIKTELNDNFLHALEFTNQIYQKVNLNAVYKTMYRYNNASTKVGTIVYDTNDNIMKDQNGKEMIYYEE